MSFWDFVILWLIVGFITVIFLSITNYKRCRMLPTIPDIIYHFILLFGGPIYCIVRITKKLHKRKYKHDSNWEKARTHIERVKK